MDSVSTNQSEQISIRNFEILYPEGNKFVLSALNHFKNHILSLGKILHDDDLKSIISIYIGSNYDPLFLSFDLLKRGYIRPTIILLRPVFESITLCMYFAEFAEKVREYRDAKNKSLWIKEQKGCWGMIEHIQKKGKLFNTHEHPDFLKNLVANPLTEMNKTIHFNDEHLFHLSGDRVKGELYIGPREIEPRLVKTIIINILQAILFSINVLGKSIKPLSLPADNDFNEIIDYLNIIKKEVTDVSPNP